MLPNNSGFTNILAFFMFQKGYQLIAWFRQEVAPLKKSSL